MAPIPPTLGASRETRDAPRHPLLRVVEDDAQRVARPARDRGHAVADRRAIEAARTADRPVARREHDGFALLERQGLTSRLRTRPLLDEQELAAVVLLAPPRQETGHLQRERDRAVEVLVQAVVAARFV